MKNYLLSLFKTKNGENRLYLLDSLRGFTIINMIVFHAIWDMVHLLDFNIPWYEGKLGYIWQQGICLTFILLSGFCVNLSKHKYYGGTVVFVSGIVVSVITYLFIPENVILFGILTFLGTAILITDFAGKILKTIPSLMGLIINTVLFIITKPVNEGYLGILDKTVFKVPEFLYHGYFASFIGFTDSSFFSADYFSLFPWLFLFLTGFNIGRLIRIEETGKEKRLLKIRIPVLTFIGQHSLIIYLAHQPVLYLATIIYNLI